MTTICAGVKKNGEPCKFKPRFDKHGNLDTNGRFCKHHYKQGCVPSDDSSNRPVLLIQRIMRGVIVRLRYHSYFNETSMFTQEPTNTISNRVTYGVFTQGRFVVIVEDFKGLLEWYTRQDGFNKPFVCIHTRIELTTTENECLQEAFAKIRRYQSDGYTKERFSIKSIKTISQKTIEIYDTLFEESYDSIFVQIFMNMTINMLDWYWVELLIHIGPNDLLNELLSSNTRDQIASIKTKCYTKDDVDLLIESSDLILKQNGIELNSMVETEIRTSYFRLFTANSLKSYCTDGDSLDWGKQSLIKDPMIWKWVAYKWLVSNNICVNPEIIGTPGDPKEICFNMMCEHPLFESYNNGNVFR